MDFIIARIDSSDMIKQHKKHKIQYAKSDQMHDGTWFGISIIFCADKNDYVSFI